MVEWKHYGRSPRIGCGRRLALDKHKVIRPVLICVMICCDYLSKEKLRFI